MTQKITTSVMKQQILDIMSSFQPSEMLILVQTYRELCQAERTVFDLAYARAQAERNGYTIQDKTPTS